MLKECIVVSGINNSGIKNSRIKSSGMKCAQYASTRALDK
jgi:hypothetical protein